MLWTFVYLMGRNLFAAWPIPLVVTAGLARGVISEYDIQDRTDAPGLHRA